MKKASKILMNLSGISGFLSIFSLLITMLFIVMGCFAGGIFVVQSIINNSSTSIWNIISVVLFLICSPLLFIGPIALLVLFVTSITSFFGVMKNKIIKVINIFFSLGGFLPLLVFGGLAILFGLLAVATPFIWLVFSPSYPDYYYMGYAYYYLSSGITYHIYLLVVIAFFALPTWSGIILGLLFTVFGLLGSVFGLFSKSKEEKEIVSPEQQEVAL